MLPSQARGMGMEDKAFNQNTDCCLVSCWKAQRAWNKLSCIWMQVCANLTRVTLALQGITTLKLLSLLQKSCMDSEYTTQMTGRGSALMSRSSKMPKCQCPKISNDGTSADVEHQAGPRQSGQAFESPSLHVHRSLEKIQILAEELFGI